MERLDKQIQETLRTVADRAQVPSSLYSAARTGKRGWQKVMWATTSVLATAAVVLILTWTGHLTLPISMTVPGHSSSGTVPPTSGRAQIIPWMSGTVRDVKDGFVELTGVTDSLRPSNPPSPSFLVPVPSGSWINKSHWRSHDGTIDLFRGQSVTYFTEQKRIMPELMFGKGDVLRRDGQTVTVRITEGIPEASMQHGVVTNVQVDPGVYSFQVAPYTHADREIKAGDKVILGVFGEPSDQIIWQVTFLN